MSKLRVGIVFGAGRQSAEVSLQSAKTSSMRWIVRASNRC
jgi:hypothetical protein